MPKRTSQLDHDFMILSLANHLSRMGHWEIQADLMENNRPPAIRWKSRNISHTPDVMSVNGEGAFLFEVETADSIAHEHTADQWRMFAVWARQKGMQFVLVVPKGFEGDALDRCLELGIVADDVWGMEGA